MKKIRMIIILHFLVVSSSFNNYIGIVVNKKSPDGRRYLIVRNIGGGQVLEDCLFSNKIIGHYRYKG